MLLSIRGRPPEADATRTIRAAIDAGITLIDTADTYCIDDTDIGHNERLLANAINLQRDGVLIATKGGCRRPGGLWTKDGRPEHLIAACDASLRALRVPRIDLYQLHAPDPAVLFSESVGALARLRDAGKVWLIGLSNVRIPEIEEARRIAPIASVQNRYNPRDRTAEYYGVIATCERYGIAFLAHSPFGGTLEAPKLSSLGNLGTEARRREVSPHRLTISWMLAKSPVIIPIPGARQPKSILDSAQASNLPLAQEDIVSIEASFVR